MFSLRMSGADHLVATAAITEIQVKSNSGSYELWAYTSGGRSFRLAYGSYPSAADAQAARARLLAGDFTL